MTDDGPARNLDGEERDDQREARWTGISRAEEAARLAAKSGRKRRLFLIVATLALGAFGGWVFDLLKMPLAWMIGALVFTTAAALAGAPLERSRRLRTGTAPVLGLMLGSAFTPDAIDHLQRWSPSLIALAVYLLAITVVVAVYLKRAAGFDSVTAFFSASPGGFGEMVLLGEAAGGDDRKISLIHSIRIMLTVMIIPFYFRFFEGYELGGLADVGYLADLGVKDGVLFLACAVIGVPLFRRIRLPAAALLGPAILSGIVHLTGYSAAKPPFEIIAIAQVVIGAGIGCRFAGVPVRRVAGVMTHGSVVTILMLGIAVLAARVLSDMTGLPFNALWLSFAPGGLAEMTLISIALGIDVAFVSIHHVARMLFLVTATPMAFKWLNKRLGWGAGEPDL